MRVLLVAGAPLEPEAAIRLKEEAADAPVLLGVDGGARTLLSLGLTPTHVSGDFDSLLPEELEALRAAGAQVLPTPDQDYTDLDKALTLATELFGAREARIFGGSGGRLDHTYSVLSALVKHSARLDGTLVDATGETWRLMDERTLTGADLIGRTLSLMALGPVEGVFASGVRWPLSGESLAPGVRDGTLNEIVAPEVTLRVASGLLLVQLHHAPVLRAG